MILVAFQKYSSYSPSVIHILYSQNFDTIESMRCHTMLGRLLSLWRMIVCFLTYPFQWPCCVYIVEQNDDITIPCYNDTYACIQAMKAINYPCMHVLLLQNISFRDDNSCWYWARALACIRVLQVYMAEYVKVIVSFIDDYLHTKLVYHSSVIANTSCTVTDIIWLFVFNIATQLPNP